MGILKTLKRKYFKYKEHFTQHKNLKLIKKNILITGVNSGIGLCILKRIVNENNVLAFVNNNSDQAEKIKTNNLSILKCDFSNIKNLDNFEQNITSFKPNIIINCAATFGDQVNLEEFHFENYYKVLNTNVIAPIVITKQSLKANSLEQVINISSEMGSINHNKTGKYFYYRSSKNLLNSFSKNLSIEFNNIINVYCIHPGSVKTKMNSGGVLDPDFVAQKIINISAENDQTMSGSLIDLNKKILPW